MNPESVAGLALLLVRPGMLMMGTPFLGGTFAPNQVKVIVTLTAPAKGEYLAYREVKAYRIK